MALFKYQSLGSSGSAVVDAPDRAAAVRILRERGVTPSSLSEQSDRRIDTRETANLAADAVGLASPATGLALEAAARVALSSSVSRVSRADLTNVIREMSIAMGAGLTLVQAMRVIQRQSRNDRIRAMLEQLIGQVEQGRSLAEAAASWGRPFDDLLVGLIRAGEQSGKLQDVLDQASILLERDLKMRRSLTMGMIYPAILAGLISLAVGVVVTFVVPQLLKPLAGRMSVSQLPWVTRVVIRTTDFATANWIWILLAIAGLVVIAQRAMAQPQTRLSIDRWVLKTPVIGRLARDVAVARFARTMGTLVGAGLPVLAALRGTRATVGNKAMEAALDEVSEAVQAGKTISEPMERAGSTGGRPGLFPPMLTQIVGVGERTGRLAEMLQRAAVVFEEKTETSIKVVTTLVPPVLVVGAAGVVGFVMAGVLLALLEVQNSIK